MLIEKRLELEQEERRLQKQQDLLKARSDIEEAIAREVYAEAIEEDQGGSQTKSRVSRLLGQQVNFVQDTNEQGREPPSKLNPNVPPWNPDAPLWFPMYSNPP